MNPSHGALLHEPIPQSPSSQTGPKEPFTVHQTSSASQPLESP